MVPAGPLAGHYCPVSYTWKGLTLMCRSKVKEGEGGSNAKGATTQELICLSLRGQQEVGLSWPDGHWPLWRQSRVKLLPAPFEKHLGLAWVIGHMGKSAIQEPPCWAGHGCGSGKHDRPRLTNRIPEILAVVFGYNVCKQAAKTGGLNLTHHIQHIDRKLKEIVLADFCLLFEWPCDSYWWEDVHI